MLENFRRVTKIVDQVFDWCEKRLSKNPRTKSSTSVADQKRGPQA